MPHRAVRAAVRLMCCSLSLLAPCVPAFSAVVVDPKNVLARPGCMVVPPRRQRPAGALSLTSRSYIAKGKALFTVSKKVEHNEIAVTPPPMNPLALPVVDAAATIAADNSSGAVNGAALQLDVAVPQQQHNNNNKAAAVVTVVDGGAVVGGDAVATPSFPVVLWRFARPHTIVGSALAIPALHLLAAPSWRAACTVRTAASVAYALLPALLMNLYITGLNQITDVAIDKINKPDLPLAAGVLRRRDAVLTCVLALAGALWLGAAHPVYSTRGLRVALWGSGILGTLYSLEPFRLKRHPLLAAFCIVAVRGTIINASFFAHAKAAAFGVPTATVMGCVLSDPRCLFSTVFFGVFGVVIALMKDVPDVLGDKVSNVRTFSVRVGPQRIFHASRRLLTGLFVSCGAGFLRLAATAATPQLVACRAITALCSLAAAVSVRNESATVDPESPSQVYKYYMHLWKIFYLSYLVLPLAR